MVAGVTVAGVLAVRRAPVMTMRSGSSARQLAECLIA